VDEHRPDFTASWGQALKDINRTSLENAPERRPAFLSSRDHFRLKKRYCKVRMLFFDIIRSNIIIIMPTLD
jgi:hypothetical protein